MALVLARGEDTFYEDGDGYEVVPEVAFHASPALVAYSTTKREIESKFWQWQNQFVLQAQSRPNPLQLSTLVTRIHDMIHSMCDGELLVRDYREKPHFLTRRATMSGEWSNSSVQIDSSLPPRR